MGNGLSCIRHSKQRLDSDVERRDQLYAHVPVFLLVAYAFYSNLFSKLSNIWSRTNFASRGFADLGEAGETAMIVNLDIVYVAAPQAPDA